MEKHLCRVVTYSKNCKASPPKIVFINQDKTICLLIQEMQLRSLGQEDPPAKEMATQSSIFAWEIPWTEPGGLQFMESQKSQIQLSD